MMDRGMNGVCARICQQSSNRSRGGDRDVFMQDDVLAEEQEDLLDLDEIMQAFGVSEWKNLGSAESMHDGSLNLLVEIEGKRYVLKEQPVGLIEEDTSHRYAFQSYLRDSGIPIPQLWLTPGGEPTVILEENVFELRQWVDGELYDSMNASNLEWVGSAGA